MSDLWVWTWVREWGGHWFPMRGSSPNIAGGYTAGPAILQPDEVDALRAELERLQKALQGERKRCAKIAADGCLVGSPTKRERNMFAAIAAAILSPPETEV